MPNATLTVQEAAKELELHVQTVRRLIHRGHLKARRSTLSPRAKYQISRSDLEEFKRQRDRA